MQNLLLLSNNIDIKGFDNFRLYCIHSDQRLRLTHEFGYENNVIEKFYEGTWSRKEFEVITEFEKKNTKNLFQSYPLDSIRFIMWKRKTYFGSVFLDIVCLFTFRISKGSMIT